VNVGRRKDYNPSQGTVSRGTGRCPRCGNTLTGDYIKTEAQGQRIGQQLYALVLKEERGRSFRLPTAEDEQAVETAEQRLAEKLPEWEAKGWVPNDDIPSGYNTDQALRYGFNRWCDMFSPRQLLSLVTYLEQFQQVKEEIFDAESKEKAKAIATYLAFVLDKCCDRNSYQARWIPQRCVLANTFDNHNFAFKWSYGEMNLTVDGLGFDWAVKQVTDAYKGLCRLAGSDGQLSFIRRNNKENRLQLTLGSAANLWEVDDESIHLICVDPPYYGNVMYSEISDFFYVWQKRTLGDVYPESFLDELTNKDDDAVANPARFGDVKSARELAEQDYEAKMGACFAEMHRVLKSEGVLTVMFTHKRVEAWDTLAMALIEAGFEITASWPIHTEFEHSLQIAKKNAAESTILLGCRKRVGHAASLSTGAWWDDISPEVSRTARQKAAQFQELGLRGVDLYISTFGPVLQIFSQNWPVKNRSGESIRPDVALNLARRAVTEYRFEQLLHGRSGQFDPATRWVILAWDIYQAEQFRYDEARKLAISVGEIDLDRDLRTRKKLIAKKSNYVVMNNPKQRVKRGQVDPDADEFECLIDAIHTAMLIYQQDGAQALRRFYERTGLLRDEGYLSAYEALLNAIPQRREEFATLRDIALALMEDKVEVPEVEQLELFEVKGEGDEENSDE